MQASYRADQWRKRFKRCTTRQERDEYSGLPVNLAALYLGISRARVYQLLKEGKLSSVKVFDPNTGQRIAHLITQRSIDKRSGIRRRPGQWRPGRMN